MNAQSAIQEQLALGHDILEQTIGDCNQETLEKNLPGATITNIGAIYAHIVFGEDMIVNGMLQGKAPVYQAAGWAGKINVEMPGPAMSQEWGRNVKLDLPAFREYAKAVYEASGAYVGGLADSDLERKIDSGFAGEQTIAWMAGILVNHVATHTGEIAALKGVQGLKGLPF